MTDLPRPALPKIPRGKTRRREILVEAARIFLRDGLDRTSMDVIATEAGTSKATLYRHFGDRHGLVVAVVEYLCEYFTADVEKSPIPGNDLRAGLRRILMHLVHVGTKPNHPKFFRLIVAGSAHDPAIGIAWNEHGPHLWHRMMAEVFADRQRAGEFSRDVDFSAFPEMLFDAVFARIIIRTAIINPGPPDDGQPYTFYIDTLLDAVLAKICPTGTAAPSDS
jgi:TetR/AcrR family transcriptional regulator, mexJK operon transcriptional repressor